MKHKSFNIKQQGLININSVIIERESPEIVCLEIDAKEKKFEIDDWSSPSEPIPYISLTIGEETVLSKDTVVESKDNSTIIKFSNYVGFEIFCFTQYKYSVRLTLIKSK